MDYIDQYTAYECGCVAQKAFYRNTKGILCETWVVTQQCVPHKEESDELRRFFSEGGDGGKDD